MELTSKIVGGNVEIIATGNIKTILDSKAIKEAIVKASGHGSDVLINFYIKDSFIITSSVIGFLVKAIKLDKIPLHVTIGSAELYVMLEEMNLIDAMNVKKVEL